MEKITSKFAGLVKIFSSIDKEINYTAKERLKLLGITKAESVYIKLIYESEGLTQYEIAKSLHMSKSLTIKHISSLEKKNIISKVEADLNKKKIYLTDKGVEIYKSFNEILELLGSIMFDDFSEKKVDEYIIILNSIKNNLNKFNKRRVNESDISHNKFD